MKVQKIHLLQCSKYYILNVQYKPCLPKVIFQKQSNPLTGRPRSQAHSDSCTESWQGYWCNPSAKGSSHTCSERQVCCSSNNHFTSSRMAFLTDRKKVSQTPSTFLSPRSYCYCWVTGYFAVLQRYCIILLLLPNTERRGPFQDWAFHKHSVLLPHCLLSLPHAQQLKKNVPWQMRMKRLHQVSKL